MGGSEHHCAALYWGKPYPREGEGGDQVPQEPGCGHRPNTNTSKIEGKLFWKILNPCGDIGHFLAALQAGHHLQEHVPSGVKLVLPAF